MQDTQLVARVKKFRKERRMTQETFSILCRITKRTIINFEQGKSVSANTVDRIVLTLMRHEAQ
jgi:transcriptional regulator with XRE-family HTH domain